jgi:hypothetical protein
MKTTSIPTFTLTAASLLFCSQASAFTDDFNSYTVGNEVAAESSGAWVDTVPTSVLQMVVVEEESPFSAVSGGHSASLIDTSSGSLGQSVGIEYVNSGSDEATIQFDYYFSGSGEDSAPSEDFDPHLIINDGSNLGAFLGLAHADEESSTGYSMTMRQPNSTFISLAEVSLDTWYRVTVTASAITDKFDVTLQESGGSASTVGTAENFRQGVTTLSNFKFVANNPGAETGVFTIDNVSVIPEPSQYAMLLGCFALSVMLLKRRIR